MSSQNPKVTTEEDRNNVSAKEKKEMLVEDKARAKEHSKPKEYSIDTFKRPLKDDKERGITELSDFKKLDKDEQKKFIIKRWAAENQYLDKKDMHEISLEDEKLAGLRP